MARVSKSDLHLAADWLDYYDDKATEKPVMTRVAEWLRKEAEARYVRNLAREHGKPLAEMRRLIEQR